MKATPLWLKVSALVLLAASAAITHFALFQQKIQGVTDLTKQISPQIGSWQQIENSPVTQSEIRGLETRDIIRRTYTHGNRRLELVVAYIAQSSRKSAHAQEACLRGAGAMVGAIQTWQMQKSPVESKLITLDFHNQRQWVCYWYKIGDLHTADYLRSSWLMFFGGLTGRKTGGAALVRLLVVQDPGESAESIQRDLEDFTVFLIPELQQHLP